MITSDELVQEVTPVESKTNENFKLAVVVDLFDNETAKIQFDGEDIASEKQYSYLRSYIPAIGDRVLLASVGGTYIILGKISFNESPEIIEEIDRYVFDEKKVTMSKGLQVTNGITSDSVTTTGSISAGSMTTTGSISAGSVTASETISGSNISTTGQVSGATLNIFDLAEIYRLNVNSVTYMYSTLYLQSNLKHDGSMLSFFNTTLKGKQTVSQLTVTPTLDNLKSKLNALISALGAYGLIGN